MRCFTETECSQWLQQRGIAKPAMYTQALQFAPPTEPGRLTAFMRNLFLAFGEFPGGLLVFEDWALYRPDEMALMTALRRGHGDERPLIEAPGHLFEPIESPEAIGYSYLSVIFAWSAYLYLASGGATICFWEGDLIDFWSPEADLVKKVAGLVEQLGSQSTRSRRS
jgi:hypothetical protein